MTSIAIATAESFGWTSIANWFKKLEAHFKAKRFQRKTVNELSRLSDRELHDIGMHRGMVGYAGREAYYDRLKTELEGRIV